jgi:hypothetical protein
METNYKGIDYGHGMSNTDPKTGIRYGVIPINSLNDFALESFEPDYGEAQCPECQGKAIDFDEDKHGEYKSYAGHRAIFEYVCESCEIAFDSEHAFPEEPIGNYFAEEGYEASLDEHNDIFITKSPFYTFAQFCSPCAPGAGHLNNPMQTPEEYKDTIKFLHKQGLYDTSGGVYADIAKKLGFPKVYCFGHDWFEGNKAPYPVFSVKTGFEIKPEKE